MARKQAVFPEINFTNGLVTEATALRFPENACTETWNCVFDRSGRVTRRPGLDVEDSYQVFTLSDTVDETDVYSEYFWEIVGTQESEPILILQRGSKLYLFNTDSELTYSDSGYFQVINLTDYISHGVSADPSVHTCSYAEGRGNLLVVNKACDPMYFEYNEETNTVVVHTFEIKYRDIKGVEDGLGLNERPTASVSSLKTSNPSHYYNIINQGWHIGDALSQWDTARTDLPSNADVPSFYRASDTDLFDNARVNNTFSQVANTPAARGHFILDAGSPSRTDALTAEGFTGAQVPELTSTLMALSGQTTVSGGTVANGEAAFDLNADQSSTTSARLNNAAYLGKAMPSGRVVRRITVVSSTEGWESGGSLQIYGKVGSAPANGTDGTLLGTLTTTAGGIASSAGGSKQILTLNLSVPTAYNYIWIRNITGGSLYVGEVYIFSTAVEYNRPQFVVFYAGRAVFAGLANEGNMNSIYFSQIIERAEQYGKCYQKNDPTDENFFDLLSDDGGVITIPAIGLIRGMVPYQNALIIIASNGVWTLSGSSRGPFKADDYEVRKISDIATLSISSVVMRRGVPVWWAEEGIYTIKYEANYDTLTVMPITEDRIYSFIQDIPVENRAYVRGAYDYNKDVIYWLYREEPFTTLVDRTTFNRALCMDGVTGAFYPWSFSEGGLLRIKGIVMVRTPSGGSAPKIKYIIENPTDNRTTFAEIRDETNWVDWYVQGDRQDYESYFITAYKIRGETMKNGQINYIMVFMEEEENASLWMQGLFDFTYHPSAGKWSTQQQCYKEGLFYTGVRSRQLKVRGKGKALQLKMRSESGKPFTIIGWSTAETVDNDV